MEEDPRKKTLKCKFDLFSLSHPDSLSNPIGGSEPSSGC